MEEVIAPLKFILQERFLISSPQDQLSEWELFFFNLTVNGSRFSPLRTIPRGRRSFFDSTGTSFSQAVMGGLGIYEPSPPVSEWAPLSITNFFPSLGNRITQGALWAWPDSAARHGVDYPVPSDAGFLHVWAGVGGPSFRRRRSQSLWNRLRLRYNLPFYYLP